MHGVSLVRVHALYVIDAGCNRVPPRTTTVPLYVEPFVLHPPSIVVVSPFTVTRGHAFCGLGTDDTNVAYSQGALDFAQYCASVDVAIVAGENASTGPPHPADITAKQANERAMRVLFMSNLTRHTRSESAARTIAATQGPCRAHRAEKHRVLSHTGVNARPDTRVAV
jgi:hypothetical protein